MLEKLKQYFEQIHGDKPQRTKGYFKTGRKISWKSKALLIWNVLYEYTIFLDAFNQRQESEFFKERWRKKSKTPKPPKDPHLIDSWSDSEAQNEIFKQFLFTNYSPPNNPQELQRHLETLFIFYNFFVHELDVTASYNMLIKMDFASIKAVRLAMIYIALINTQGVKSDSIFSRIKGKKKKSEEKRDAALNIYWREKREKFNSWAEIKKAVVEKMIDKEILPKPNPDEKLKDHTKQIERYLLSDSRIKEIWKK